MKLLTTIIALAATCPIVATVSRFPRRAFGISTSYNNRQSSTSSCLNTILDTRGGAVHESPTLSDLDSRIQSAALQDKLTVIDFTATW